MMMLHNHKYCRYQDYGDYGAIFDQVKSLSPSLPATAKGFSDQLDIQQVKKNDDLIVIALSVIGVIGNHDDTVYNDIIYMIYYHNNNNIDDNSDDYSVDHQDSNHHGSNIEDDAYVDTNNDNDDADGHGCGGGFLQGLTSFFIRNSAVAAFR